MYAQMIFHLKTTDNIGDVDHLHLCRESAQATDPVSVNCAEGVSHFLNSYFLFERSFYMETVFVIANDGSKLMPTNTVKARKLIRAGKAVIEKHTPFTIRLVYESLKNIQPVEIGVDTGYKHIGLSVKSEKHEYISAQYDLLKDEVKHHNDNKKYRKARRNRLRYRKPRFYNRNKPKGWLAPSLKNKADTHVRLIKSYYDVCPVNAIYIECGQFDTQVIKAIKEGNPIPYGKAYQRGEQYGYDTLREALFSRDKYTCQICKRTPWKNNISLHRHHIGYWKNDRTNRMNNLLTVCNFCHTKKNHQPGGALYGLKSKTPNMAGAAFMNTVKNNIYQQISEFCDNTYITYGTVTKHVRRQLNIGKTHADDAFCIGMIHPKHRSKTSYYEKRRRNNRILSTFKDAKYIDSRDGSVKSGKQLSSGRTNRNHDRDSENLHIYRQCKKKKGFFSVRKRHYSIQSGDIIMYQGKKYISKGCHVNGTKVKFSNGNSILVKKVTVISHAGSWKKVEKSAS